MPAGQRQQPARGARASRKHHSERRVALCAGLKSSGSTWLYNAVIQVCEFGHRTGSESVDRWQFRPFYADRIEDFPRSAKAADFLIIKTHIPSPSLAFLTSFIGGTVFMTIREPRDSVSSLMTRFGHRFETSLEEVGRSAARLVALSDVQTPVIFRYEAGFVRRRATVARLARQLGIVLPSAVSNRVYASLTADNVKRKIDSLAKKGVFGAEAHPDSFDARTHWHPAHVGDCRIGKYAEILSPEMQQQVLCATTGYCAKFGYTSEVRARP